MAENDIPDTPGTTRFDPDTMPETGTAVSLLDVEEVAASEPAPGASKSAWIKANTSFLLFLLASAGLAIGCWIAVSDGIRLGDAMVLTSRATATILVLGVMASIAFILAAFSVRLVRAKTGKIVRFALIGWALAVLLGAGLGVAASNNAQFDAEHGANAIGAANVVTGAQIEQVYEVKVVVPASGDINRATTSKIIVNYLDKDVKCFTPDAQSLKNLDPLVCEGGLAIGATAAKDKAK